MRTDKERERRAFIWKNGVVRAGMPVGVVTAVMNYAGTRGPELHGYLSIRFALALLVHVVFAAIIGGWLWGATMWKRFGDT